MQGVSGDRKQDIQLGTPHVIAVVRIGFLLGTPLDPPSEAE